MPKNTILTLPENKKGRDFVVGDIHGAYDLLDKALIAIKFDQKKDRLISVGDLINRGRHNTDCLRYLSKPWFYAISGNHEIVFQYVYKDGKVDFSKMTRPPKMMAWMKDQTRETMDAIRTAFENLPIVIEIQTERGLIGFVHGDIPENMSWTDFKKKISEKDKATTKNALFGRNKIQTANDNNVEGISRIFLGHTPVASGPKKFGNCFFIDTGGVFKQMKPDHKDDLFLTVTNIHADKDQILKPTHTDDPLVRVVIPAAPKIKPAPKPPKPSF